VLTEATVRRPPNAGIGRKKGVPNKLTTAAKEAYALAFEGLGGVQGLVEWAQRHRSEFYKIHSKLIPVELNSGAEGGLVMRVEFVNAPSHEA
jgi:hypothetical protein